MELLNKTKESEDTPAQALIHARNTMQAIPPMNGRAHALITMHPRWHRQRNHCMPPSESIDMDILKLPLKTLSTEQAALSRRSFLSTCSLAAAGLVLGCSRSSEAAGIPIKTTPGKVTVVVFSNAGKRLRTVNVDRVIKPDAAWKQQLSPLSYQVTRHASTERPFTGSLLEEHRKGVFRCICCDTALFDSTTKFESGTGWPSYWQPIAKENVIEDRDSTLGMVRTEIRCTRCEAHLGHVFDDGPRPTGLRYCMNSVSLRFTAAT